MAYYYFSGWKNQGNRGVSCPWSNQGNWGTSYAWNTLSNTYPRKDTGYFQYLV
jgi:hypothetical protein